MRRNIIRIVVIAALVALIPTIAITWGNEGHMAINRAAAQKVPADMPQFLKNASDHIAYLGPEPDRWREKSEATLKYAQEPEHFMDMEMVDWLKPLPNDRFLFIKAVYEHRAQMKPGDKDYEMMTPEKIGLQPYAAIETYDKLKVAFREYRKALKENRSTADAEANVLQYAGVLGHYVGDGSNPLHTTVQYNGWTGPNPNGYTTEHDIHWKMEGLFISQNINQLPFADLVTAPKRLENPMQDYLAYMRESQSHVEEVYKLEKACGFEGAGTAESREFLRKRLAAGSQMLLNMWYTAWMESGKEPAPYNPGTPRKKAEKTCPTPAAIPAK
jgi:hypothetical protein